MNKIKDEIQKRKLDHIEICTDNNYNIEMDTSTNFEDIQFVHKALPEINYDEISLSTQFLSKKLSYPIIISSITGGTPEAYEINKKLAQVAEELQIAFAVGSQRGALSSSAQEKSFKITREKAPTTFIAANIGAVQLNYNFTEKHAQKAINMIDADALILHLNPLQELVQPEGNRNFKELLPKIEDLCSKIERPIIIKEVGSGIALEEGIALLEAGVEAIDVAGAGGTSWAKIEAERAQKGTRKQKLGELFANWGIPTAISTIELSALKEEQLQVISSGGIRNGVDAVKAMAIGADLVGMALPFIRIAIDGTVRQIIEFLEQFIEELKTTMFLTGAKTLTELQLIPLVITGYTAQWLSARGLDE